MTFDSHHQQKRRSDTAAQATSGRSRTDEFGGKAISLLVPHQNRPHIKWDQITAPVLGETMSAPPGEGQ